MVEDYEKRDHVFRALADPSRRLMIERLSKRDLTVGELAQPLAMSLAGASKHVRVLELAGILVREKRGRERVCSLKPDGLLAMRDWVARYSAFWDTRLDALDRALREDEDD